AAFAECTALEKINLNELPNLETIGSSAFFRTNLKHIKIDAPNLKYIGDGAFAKSQLTSFSLRAAPDAVIDQGAFSEATSLDSICLKSKFKISGKAFEGCPNIQSLIFLKTPEIYKYNVVNTEDPKLSNLFPSFPPSALRVYLPHNDLHGPNRLSKLDTWGHPLLSTWKIRRTSSSQEINVAAGEEVPLEYQLYRYGWPLTADDLANADDEATAANTFGALRFHHLHTSANLEHALILSQSIEHPDLGFGKDAKGLRTLAARHDRPDTDRDTFTLTLDPLTSLGGDQGVYPDTFIYTVSSSSTPADVFDVFEDRTPNAQGTPGIRFVVISDTEVHLTRRMVTGLPNSALDYRTLTDMVIPATVLYQDGATAKSYTVTGIDDSDFEDCTALTRIKLLNKNGITGVNETTFPAPADDRQTKTVFVNAELINGGKTVPWSTGWAVKSAYQVITPGANPDTSFTFRYVIEEKIEIPYQLWDNYKDIEIATSGLLPTVIHEPALLNAFTPIPGNPLTLMSLNPQELHTTLTVNLQPPGSALTPIPLSCRINALVPVTDTVITSLAADRDPLLTKESVIVTATGHEEVDGVPLTRLFTPDSLSWVYDDAHFIASIVVENGVRQGHKLLLTPKKYTPDDRQFPISIAYTETVTYSLTLKAPVIDMKIAVIENEGYIPKMEGVHYKLSEVRPVKLQATVYFDNDLLSPALYPKIEGLTPDDTDWLTWQSAQASSPGSSSSAITFQSSSGFETILLPHRKGTALVSYSLPTQWSSSPSPSLSFSVPYSVFFPGEAVEGTLLLFRGTDQVNDGASLSLASGQSLNLHAQLMVDNSYSLLVEGFHWNSTGPPYPDRGSQRFHHRER
ncbi:MAG: leucine-rich repeat domain-containing protein, partial [Tannerellaceae bacterium]|nr:leucine-rich repeat domain-containing protein [Tannerellaceae bacterium]